MLMSSVHPLHSQLPPSLGCSTMPVLKTMPLWLPAAVLALWLVQAHAIHLLCDCLPVFFFHGLSLPLLLLLWDLLASSSAETLLGVESLQGGLLNVLSVSTSVSIRHLIIIFLLLGCCRRFCTNKLKIYLFVHSVVCSF